MTIQEQIREIMLSEELSDSEKLDRLHALIPADVFKIDDLNPSNSGTTQAIERWLSNYRSDATDQACRTTRKRNGAKPKH